MFKRRSAPFFLVLSCVWLTACSESGGADDANGLGVASTTTSGGSGAPTSATPGPMGEATSSGVISPLPPSTPGGAGASAGPDPVVQTPAPMASGGTPGVASGMGGAPAAAGGSDGGRGATPAAGGEGEPVMNGGNGGDSPVAGAAGAESGTAGTSGSNTSPCDGMGTLMEGDSEHTLTVGDYTYPFNVHAPPGYDGETRMPVVFDFHGLGGNEDQMIRLSGWASAGDAHGFITVFPGGPDNGWNAGGCCTDTPTDVDFVREAIAYLDTQGCIDTKRIYASGCSNGGAMSFRLACEAADVIAAVAPVDFDCVAGNGFGCECEPVRPITEIQFRGTNDSAVDYGEETTGARGNFATWGEINMCSGTPGTLPENDACQRHTDCADGVESILCTVQDGSHCGSYMSFGIAELAWEIISRYSLP